MPASTVMPFLSDRIKISFQPETMEEFSCKNVSFYMKYAACVFRTLKKPSFQRFLRWMIKNENIGEHAVRDVQIRVLPFRRKNKRGIAGNCNTQKGNIRIYPRTKKSCRKLIQEVGKEKFLLYVRIRARATLMHEILHMKYSSNEQKVRELTKRYFQILMRKRFLQCSSILSVYNMIFRPESASFHLAATTLSSHISKGPLMLPPLN